MKRMLDHHQYFPVLRWKSSERQALCTLDPVLKNKVTPVFELVPKDFEKGSTDVILKKSATQMAKYWGWRNLFFVDFNLLGENRAAHCLPIFLNHADAYNLRAGLVTGLNHSDNFQLAVKAAAAKTGRELCLRVNAYELRQAGFQQAVKNLLGFLGKKPTGVHLVIDFQNVGYPLPEIAAFLNTIPNLDDWRSLTVISGAFPKDLSDLEKHHQYELPRNDWLIWKNYATTAKGRIPSFGDYTIQHGVFEEHEGKHFNFSASLRYTSEEYWVIMRGEGVMNENGAGYQQFPAQAQLLLERSEFRGREFSSGDMYIYAMAQQTSKSGQAKDWLIATFNHHITLTVWQLNNLFAPANNNVPLSELNPSLHIE